MKIDKWLKLNTTSLSNKNVAIFGSTGGLGNEIVKYLSILDANLILINRNKNKTNKQIENIKQNKPNLKVEFISCDLLYFKNVKEVVNILKEKNIDILIFNTGIYNVKRFKTDIDMDNIFQVNFFAPYYIYKELSSNLNNAKVIILGSIAHNYNKININDIEFLNNKKSSAVYGNSKRFLMFSFNELFKNETKNKLAIVHPGITLTNMTNHYPKAINWLVKIGIKLVFPSPKKASLSVIKGVFEDCKYNEWIGPKFLNIWCYPKLSKLKTCKQEEKEKIFHLAEDLYNKFKN